MHELLYYSIFAIILYFVLTQVFENFNIEQENFDPSLVPVSSIVTLAKVAQKLVNGNGTLTNPGNLQIGASASAPGNLTVTGGINVTGSNGTISVTEVDGHPINNALSVGKVTVGTFAPDPSHDIIRSGGSNGLLLSNASKKIYIWNKNDLYCQNNLSVTSNTTVGGTTTLNGNNSFKGADSTPAGAGDMRTHFPNSDGNNYIRGNTFTSGNLSATGNIQANGNVDNGTLGAGRIQIGKWADRPALWANDTANNLIIHNDGNKTVQIGASGAYPNNLQVTGSITSSGALMANNNLFIGNKAMLYSNGDKFANDNWMRLMKADGSSTYSGMDGGGFAVSNLYSQQDTTVNRNLQVNGTSTFNNLTTINHDLTATGNLRFCSNPAANGISIGAGVGLPSGNRGLRMGGNLQLCDPADVSKCATLVYDSAKNMIVVDKGFKIDNPLNYPGILTDSVVFKAPGRIATNNAKDGGSIEWLATSILNHGWIPNGSMSMVGLRNDQYDDQHWFGHKRSHPHAQGLIHAAYHGNSYHGGYLNA